MISVLPRERCNNHNPQNLTKFYSALYSKINYQIDMEIYNKTITWLSTGKFFSKKWKCQQVNP